MHFMLFLDRSCHASKCLPVLTSTKATSVIHLIIVAIVFLSTPAQGRVIGTPSLEHPEELFVVEDFKRRLLDHMGLTAPPTLHEDFRNASLVRERFRHRILDFSTRMMQDQLNTDGVDTRLEEKLSQHSRVVALDPSYRAERHTASVTQDGVGPTLIAQYRFKLPNCHGQGQGKGHDEGQGQHGNCRIAPSSTLQLQLQHHNNRRLRRAIDSRKSHIVLKVSLRNPHSKMDKNSSDFMSGNASPTSSVLLKSFIVRPHQIPYTIHIDDIKHLFPDESTFNCEMAFDILATEIFSSTSNLDRRSSVDVGKILLPIIENSTHSSNSTGKDIIINDEKENIDDNRHNKNNEANDDKNFIIKIKPVLKIKISPIRKRKLWRSRRSAESNNNNNNNNNNCSGGSSSSNGTPVHCCPHRVYISFSEIGWDRWVLSPEGYTAYFCKGACPDRYQWASSFTGIKALLHQLHPSIIPAPTCAASGYRPIKLLYLGENNNLVEAKYPSMIVTGCKCY